MPAPTIKDKLAWRAKDMYWGRVGISFAAGPLKGVGHSASDECVWQEIFGDEDAYRRDITTPMMRGGVVVEVGAHKGYFTVLAASVAQRVLVFEPDETNHRYLLQNVQVNGCTNVTVFRQAMADAEGTRTFMVSELTDARHTFFPTAFSGPGKSQEVSCTTLAAALSKHNVDTVDVLKLDCEGSEYDVLLTADADTLAKIKNIAVEIHESPAHGHSSAELVDFLESHGFSSELYDEHQRDDLRTSMGIFRRTALPR